MGLVICPARQKNDGAGRILQATRKTRILIHRQWAYNQDRFQIPGARDELLP
jgi:hypothetical protein